MSANRFVNHVYAESFTIVPLRRFVANRTLSYSPRCPNWFTLPANSHAFRNHEPTKPRPSFASYGARARRRRD